MPEELINSFFLNVSSVICKVETADSQVLINFQNVDMTANVCNFSLDLI